MRAAVDWHPANRLRKFRQNPNHSRLLNNLERALFRILCRYRRWSAARSTTSVWGWELILGFRLRLENFVLLWRHLGIESLTYHRVERTRSGGVDHSSRAIGIVASGQIRVIIRGAGRRSARRQYLRISVASGGWSFSRLC